MRDKHRDDLKEAQAQTIKAMQDTIIVQADMIDYLRAKLDGHAYVAPRTQAINPTKQPPAEEAPAGKMWLSEEEEEILALNMQGHISDLELQRLREELGMEHLVAVPHDDE